MVSYKWSIETTIRLSRIVAEILRVKHVATHFSIENAVITILETGGGGKLRVKVFSGFAPITAPETRVFSY